MKIATIIVGYKNDDLSISYISKELSKIHQDNVVVIVNNSSTDESNSHLANVLNGEIVKRVDQHVDTTKRFFVIDSKDNLGFAKANNLGVEFINHSFPEIEYILFSNNDIKIKDANVVEVLINKLRTIDGIGIITPNIIGIDGRRQTPQERPEYYRWLKDDWKSLLRMRNSSRGYAELADEGFHYTFSECFFIARLRDFNACGMFDPHTFLYAEGVILSERMLGIQLRYYFDPSVTVIHENGTTTSKNITNVKMLSILKNANFYYFEKYRGISPFAIKVGEFFSWLRLTITKIKNKEGHE